MGISRDQLASIETERSRLRFDPAWKACRALNLNPIWLAFGESAQAPFVFYGFEPEERAAITEQTSFIDGFRMIAKTYAVFWQAGAENERAGRAVAINSAPIWQAALDTSPTIDIPWTMSRWNVLRKRMQKVAAIYGAKSKIALACGVTRQAVDQWLGGESAPKAETTLRLLEWVAAEEANQKKSAGSVSETRPARKTRARKSKYEKPNSDQKKK